MKKKIKIGGEDYSIGPMTLGVRHWIQATFTDDQTWNEKCAKQDASVLAETCHRLLDANGKEKFKTPVDLMNAMPGNTKYLFLTYMKIAAIYGLDFPDVERFDMDAITDKQIGEINAEMEARLPKVESKKKPTASTSPEAPSAGVSQSTM